MGQVGRKTPAHREAVSRRWDGRQRASRGGGRPRLCPSGQVLVGPPELDEEEKPEEGEEDEDERVAFPDVEHGDLLVVAAGSLEHCRAAA